MAHKPPGMVCIYENNCVTPEGYKHKVFEFDGNVAVFHAGQLREAHDMGIAIKVNRKAKAYAFVQPTLIRDAKPICQ